MGWRLRIWDCGLGCKVQITIIPRSEIKQSLAYVLFERMRTWAVEVGVERLRIEGLVRWDLEFGLSAANPAKPFMKHPAASLPTYYYYYYYLLLLLLLLLPIITVLIIFIYLITVNTLIAMTTGLWGSGPEVSKLSPVSLSLNGDDHP